MNRTEMQATNAADTQSCQPPFTVSRREPSALLFSLAAWHHYGNSFQARGRYSCSIRKRPMQNSANLKLRLLGSLIFLVLLASGCSSASSTNIYVERVITPTPDLNFERSIDPTPPGTLPELIASLASDNAVARIVAAKVLADMGPKAEPAVFALIGNLSYQTNSEVRESAARALGAIGSAAKSAVPQLTKLLLTDFVNVQSAAAVALGQIGDTSAIPALAQGLNDRYIEVSIESAKSIAILANQEFPDFNSTSYSLDENGVPLIVKAAREWWMHDGQYQNWSQP